MLLLSWLLDEKGSQGYYKADPSQSDSEMLIESPFAKNSKRCANAEHDPINIST